VFHLIANRLNAYCQGADLYTDESVPCSQASSFWRLCSVWTPLLWGNVACIVWAPVACLCGACDFHIKLKVWGLD